MNSKFTCIIILLFLFTFCNAQPSKAYQDELLKLYPDATQADWEERGNYEVAIFNHNGFEMKVWMNKKAQWVMSVSDIQTTDELPPKVYNTFTMTQYSQWNVINVFWVTFSDMEEQFIIKVNQDNSSQTNDLFFVSSGEEVRNLDVSDENVDITPTLFDIQEE